jgi:hypothetical protein
LQTLSASVIHTYIGFELLLQLVLLLEAGRAPLFDLFD